MSPAPESITAQITVEAWANRAIIDFYAAFELEQLFELRLFFYHQALEKLCKAYLIGKQEDKYKCLAAEYATDWIESYAKSLSHNLIRLLSLVVADEPSIEPLLRHEEFIELLMKGYEEGRYPRPRNMSIWVKPGFSTFMSSTIDRRAYWFGNRILGATRIRFGLDLPIQNPLSNIDSKQRERFIRIWDLRSE